MSKKGNKIPKFMLNAFYESKFRDNLFIIKAGGKVIEDPEALNNLIINCRDLCLHGVKILLIYGGGRAMDEESARRGIEVKKLNGLRINAAENIEVLKHVVAGDLSLEVSGAMARAGFDGLSFNAVPPEWMDISLAPKTDGDIYTGAIDRVYDRPIRRLFRITNFVACACIGVTRDKGITCNINADRIATQLAINTKADKLLFLSDVDGVLIDGVTADIIPLEDIPKMIENGQATDGMRVKLENCARALEAGVKRVHLINGLRRDALKKEILEPVGPGTMLLLESEKDQYLNEIKAQKVIEKAK